MCFYALLWILPIVFCISTAENAPVLRKAPKGWRCPDLSNDWIDLGGEQCYLFEKGKLVNWNEAHYECGRKGGILPSIHSDADNLMLKPYVENAQDALFIGLHKNEYGLFEWADGSSFDYVNWHEGEPNGWGDKCGELWTKQMQWNDYGCHGRRGYICSAKKMPPNMEDINTSASNSAAVLKEARKSWRCPDLWIDWVDLGGEKCYFFETQKYVTWYEANYECGRKGGILASIHSEEETRLMEPYVKYKQDALFIVLHKRKNGIFEWADGSKFDFINWHDGEPNDKEEKCGELWTTQMQWNDYPCERTRGYICSTKKIPPNMEDISSPASILPDKVEKNVSACNECVCPSGISTKTMAIIVISILIVEILAGIVIYYSRQFWKRRHDKNFGKSKTPSSLYHISSDALLKPNGMGQSNA